MASQLYDANYCIAGPPAFTKTHSLTASIYKCSH